MLGVLILRLSLPFEPSGRIDDEVRRGGECPHGIDTLTSSWRNLVQYLVANRAKLYIHWPSQKLTALG
jgi:hypothetical protein